MKFKEMIIHQNNHSLTYFSLAPKLIKYYRRGNFFSIVLAAYNYPIHFKHDMMIPVKVRYKIESVVKYQNISIILQFNKVLYYDKSSKDKEKLHKVKS